MIKLLCSVLLSPQQLQYTIVNRTLRSSLVHARTAGHFWWFSKWCDWSPLQFRKLVYTLTNINWLQPMRVLYSPTSYMKLLHLVLWVDVKQWPVWKGKLVCFPKPNNRLPSHALGGLLFVYGKFQVELMSCYRKHGILSYIICRASYIKCAEAAISNIVYTESAILHLLSQRQTKVGYDVVQTDLRTSIDIAVLARTASNLCRY